MADDDEIERSDEPRKPKTASYRNPPKHGQFREGQSGNPKGRPPKSKNVSTLLTKALDERVTVTENGRRRQRTMREIIVVRLVNKSAGADMKALTILLGLVAQIEAAAETRQVPRENLSEAERAILKTLGERLRKGDA